MALWRVFHLLLTILSKSSWNVIQIKREAVIRIACMQILSKVLLIVDSLHYMLTVIKLKSLASRTEPLLCINGAFLLGAEKQFEQDV